MSDSPYLTLEDLQELKNASRYHLDYLVSSGVRREHPELYEKARRANFRLIDMVSFLENNPQYKQIELKKPKRELY